VEELEPDFSYRKSVEGLEAVGNVSDCCNEFSETIIHTHTLDPKMPSKIWNMGVYISKETHAFSSSKVETALISHT